jgi:hypothetical protein
MPSSNSGSVTGRGRFHLEITSIEEFALLCALIRDDKIEDAEIRKQIEKLKVAETDLNQAVKSDQKG